MAIQPIDRQEWLSHPVTQEFLQLLRESRKETLEIWATEGYIGDTAEQSAMRNAKALGGVQVLQDIIEKIEDIGAIE